MPGTCVVGLQWGDEAKGKIVDLLTPDFDFVVRYQGGANAGHTVVVGADTYKLHQIPSGILNPRVKNLISPGVVLNPPIVLTEIDSLVQRGIRVGDNLLISDRAHVVFPWHLEEDRILNESPVEGENIGTTLRGIGPCYRDKVGRNFAIRLGDLYRSDFPEKVQQIVVAKRSWLNSLAASKPIDLDGAAIVQQYRGYAARLEPHVADTTPLLLDARGGRPARVVRRGPRGLAGHRPRHLSIRDQQQ